MAKRNRVQVQAEAAETAVFDGYEQVETPKEPQLELFRNADGDQLAALPTCPFCENWHVHLLEHKTEGWYVYRICTECYKGLRAGKFNRKEVNQKIWPAVPRAKREKKPTKAEIAEARVAELEAQLALLTATATE